MNEIIYKGLLLKSPKNCAYFTVKEGNTNSLVEDVTTSNLTLTYIPGSTSAALSEYLGIDLIGKDQELTPTYKTVKFSSSNTIVSLNGLRLKKLTSDTHIINIIIATDTESRVVQDYNYTTIVVSPSDATNEEFIRYLFYSGNLLYLQPVGPMPKCWTIKNFPKITVKDKSLNLASDSTTIYTLRRRYNDYVIRAIDYQDQFILEMRRIFEDYGVELVRVNKEGTLTKTGYVSYQFTQTPTKIHHSGIDSNESRVIYQKIPVDFTLRTPDMVMFFDFKNKFNNVDLVTNFCEFKTADKYGERWTASIKWGQITEDFNHVYQQDDNSNFSYQCQFRCELYFYEVFDDRYEFLNEILSNLETSA